MVIPIYILIEYSSNYSGMTGSLWFNSKDEATVFGKEIANDNAFKSFKCKTKCKGILKNATIALPLNISVIFGNHSKSH